MDSGKEGWSSGGRTEDQLHRALDRYRVHQKIPGKTGLVPKGWPGGLPARGGVQEKTELVVVRESLSGVVPD